MQQVQKQVPKQEQKQVPKQEQKQVPKQEPKQEPVQQETWQVPKKTKVQNPFTMPGIFIDADIPNEEKQKAVQNIVPTKELRDTIMATEEFKARHAVIVEAMDPKTVNMLEKSMQPETY